MKLSGVMLGSDNPQILGEFYTKILGRPGWQEDDWYGYDVGGGSLMIGPHSEVKGRSGESARMIITLETEDVRGDFARIKDMGAEVVAEPYQPDKVSSPNTWLATFADPDGNYFQLNSPWEE